MDRRWRQRRTGARPAPSEKSRAFDSWFAGWLDERILPNGKALCFAIRQAQGGGAYIALGGAPQIRCADSGRPLLVEPQLLEVRGPLLVFREIVLLRVVDRLQRIPRRC